MSQNSDLKYHIFIRVLQMRWDLNQKLHLENRENRTVPAGQKFISTLGNLFFFFVIIARMIILKLIGTIEGKHG